MDIDDKDFSIVRKNFNILSVLILILAFTNAQLHSLNFLGIQLELDGFKLYLALFVGYAYFFWRFLTKLPLKSGFWNDFSNYYINSEEGVKRVHNLDRYRDELIDKSSHLKYAIEGDPHYRFIQTNVVRFNPKEFRKLRLAFLFNITPKSSEQHSNFNIDHDITVSRFYFVRCLIVFCVKYDKFGDYLFPLIPLMLNVYFFLCKPEWQGSFKSLFLTARS